MKIIKVLFNLILLYVAFYLGFKYNEEVDKIIYGIRKGYE